MFQNKVQQLAFVGTGQHVKVVNEDSGEVTWRGSSFQYFPLANSLLKTLKGDSLPKIGSSMEKASFAQNFEILNSFKGAGFYVLTGIVEGKKFIAESLELVSLCDDKFQQNIFDLYQKSQKSAA